MTQTQSTSNEPSCIFCRILRGEIPSTLLRKSERSVIIADISPQAPFHALVLPRRHAADLGAFMKDAAPGEIDDLFAQALTLIEERGFGRKGYRIVINTGEDGGQTVGHLHLHLLAGRNLGWPPG